MLMPGLNAYRLARQRNQCKVNVGSRWISQLQAYNQTIMRKLFGGVIVGVLVVALAVLSYAVSRVIMRVAAVEKYQQEVFAPEKYPPEPAELSQLVTEISNKVKVLGGSELELMQFDLLCLYAWYFPDQSADVLKQALPLGEKLYKSFTENRQYIGERLAFCYVYAALPDQLERWLDETNREPVLRPYVLYNTVWARILEDNPHEATALIEAELERFPSVQSRAFALVGYTILDELQQAEKYAQAWEGEEYIPQVYDYVFAQYLVQQADFESALAHLQSLQQARENPQLDPDDAMLMLTACVGAQGWGESQCATLLERAAQSTRKPATLEGIRARALAALYAATGNEIHLSQLRGLVVSSPDDYDVAAALALAELERAAASEPLHAGATLPASCAAALELAQTPVQLQEAHLLAARACCDLRDESSVTVKLRELALDYLATALGDPQASSEISDQRVPEYESFLLDKDVVELRKADPKFDKQVHTLIENYLARRRALFADILLPEGVD